MKKTLLDIINETVIRCINENNRKMTPEELTTCIRSCVYQFYFDYQDVSEPLNPHDFIAGDCGHLVSYLRAMGVEEKGARIMWLLNLWEGCPSLEEGCVNVEHWFVELDGRYYDGYNDEGVDRVCNLQFCQEYYLPDWEDFLGDEIGDVMSFEQYCDMCMVPAENNDIGDVQPATGLAGRRQAEFNRIINYR